MSSSRARARRGRSGHHWWSSSKQSEELTRLLPTRTRKPPRDCGDSSLSLHPGHSIDLNGNLAPPPAKKVKLASQAQFSISTFLPKLSPHTSAAAVPLPSAKKRARDETRPAVPSLSREKGKGRAKDSEVVFPLEGEEKYEDALWVDQFGPRDRDELGVHPKKVQDVLNWLEEAYNPKLAKYRRLLVLSGPSGAAKTAVLRILAQEMGVQILEYRNGSNHTFATDDNRESMVNQFTNFLARAGMAPALDLGPDPSLSSFPTPASSSHLSPAAQPTPSASPSTSSSTTPSRRLILLEDLPNTSHYPTKLALRSALQQYLASPRVTCPLVVIVSEALERPGVGHEAESSGWSGGGGGRGESVDARSVCGIEVLQAPGCREIQFNAIAPTIMKKALTKTLDRVYPALLPAASRPSVKTLDVIIAHSNGDIRSALMSLQFLASDPEMAGVTSLAGGAGKKGKKRKIDDAGGGVGEGQVKQLLQYVTARESSLFIFHALGKVLFAKRWDQDAAEDKKDTGRLGIEPYRKVERLPKHLRAEWTRAPPKVNPDVLFAEAPVDSDIFLSYLQHNYTAYTNEIEECQGIAEHLSMADGLMRLEGEEWLQRAPLTSQYSFNLAVRGTLLHLPSPVPRRKQVMRKSALWDTLRHAGQNAEGVEELFGGASSKDIVEAGGQRQRRSVMVDFVPFVGVIRKKGVRGYQAFLTDLATFPPVGANNSKLALTGEALGEREVEEEVEDESEDKDVGAVEDNMEVEDEVPVSEGEGEEWFDPDDDITEF